MAKNSQPCCSRSHMFCTDARRMIAVQHEVVRAAKRLYGEEAVVVRWRMLGAAVFFLWKVIVGRVASLSRRRTSKSYTLAVKRLSFR